MQQLKENQQPQLVDSSNSQAGLVMGAWSGARRKAWIPPGHIRAKWGDPAEKVKWFRKRQRKKKEKQRRSGDVHSDTGSAGSDIGESELRAREAPAASEESNSVVQQLQREKEQLQAQLKHVEWHRKESDRRLQREKVIVDSILDGFTATRVRAATAANKAAASQSEPTKSAKEAAATEEVAMEAASDVFCLLAAAAEADTSERATQ